MTHNTRLHWAGESATLSAAELRDWRRQTAKDGDIVIVEVIGPCPSCGGVAQGYLPPETSVHLLKASSPKPTDDKPTVGVTCNCGSSHHQEGATGCGRFWEVPFKDLEDS
jgi:hypothetical protein